MSLLMVSLALVFPSFLRREKVLEWGLLVFTLLLTLLGIMIIRDHIIAAKQNKSADDNNEAVLTDSNGREVVELKELSIQKAPERCGILSEHVDSEAIHIEPEELKGSELIVPEEPIDPEEPEELQTTEEEEILKWTEEPVRDLEARTDNKEFSLDQLIEKGFQAKEQGRYHLAAEWFILALDKKPSYDIAYYLIVEACEYWMNGLSTHDALDKVGPYFNEYIQNAPPDWGMKLMEWLKNEKLPFPGNYLGRID